MIAPACARPGIPWYIHPAEDPGAWRNLARHFTSARGLRDGFAVINVHNGPCSADDPYYGRALSELSARAPGLALLGYVDVDYGNRPELAVLDDAAAWQYRYGLTALMLDRFPSRLSATGDIKGSEGSKGTEAASSSIVDTVARLRENGIDCVVGNPGTVPSPEIRTALDITCEFEGTGDDYAAALPPGGPGTWHLVHSCSPGQLEHGNMMPGIAPPDYLFATDRLMPHPWGGFPRTSPC